MRLVGSERYSPAPNMNLKWSVADTDKILASAKDGQTAFEIADAISVQNKQIERTTPEEVIKICKDAGQHVRR